MSKRESLLIIGGLGVGFGAFALWLGYDSVLIGSVFTFLGAVAGYLYGKKEEKKG